MSREEHDKKNKRVGMIISAITHVAVLLLFIFLVAWRAPNPPLPEFGIELNFGTSDAGSGEDQPEPFTPPADTESEEDAPETPVEEVEDIPEEVVEETSQETPVPVEETQETTEVQEEVIPVTEQPTEDPVKQPETKEVKETPKEKVVEEKPKELPKVLYPGKTDGTANEAKNANQGDKTDAVGDQGDKEGNVDARSLYGKAGGGGGAALEMVGWMWDREPDPKETTSQDGKIVFEVTIDDRGQVISSRAVSYTVSISLMKTYQAEVDRLTFSKTSSGPAPATTKGVITFIIKTK